MARKPKAEPELRDILERVTRAEERLISANLLLTGRHDELRDSLEDIDMRMKTLEGALSRYQGFAGGILLVITALSAMATLFWNFMIRKFAP